MRITTPSFSRERLQASALVLAIVGPGSHAAGGPLESQLKELGDAR